jgi:integrase
MQPSDSAPRKLRRHVRAHPNWDARIRKSERADGTWVYEIRFEEYDPKTGKTKRKYETVGTRADQVKARLAEVTTAASRGERVSDPNMTVQQLFEQYSSTHTLNRDQERNLRIHVLARWNKTKLRDLHHADLSAWWPTLKTQSGEKMAESTVGLVLAHFSAMLSYAVEIDKLAANPVKAMPQHRRPKRGESRQRILSRDEEARLLAYTAPFAGIEDIVRVALNQALRLGEVLGLQWDDVDFAKDKLRVRHSWGHDGTLGKTKHAKLTGKRDPRDLKPIDLMPVTREILLRLRMDADGTGPVFHNSLGRHYDRRQVQRNFQTAVERAALPVTDDGAVNFHSLRHTCLSRLANNAAVPLVYVRDFAGHTDLSITNGYVHAEESSTITEAAAKALAGVREDEEE